ncbi:MAG: DUF3696 domain-containing protein [Ardenticatenales bacterium]|nr:DUF3696 domain-containing protein [Ardenticatenales bacterium]
MLTELTLESFKCFSKLRLPLAPLTILSGLNASGKSTVLQALSILHQTIATNEHSTRLLLNGPTINLGTASEVIDNVSGRDSFRIELEWLGAHRYGWTMQSDDRHSDLAIPIESVMVQEADQNEAEVFRVRQRGLLKLLPEGVRSNRPIGQQLSESLERLTYISADRIGPRDTYPTAIPGEQINVGVRGEYAPWFLSAYADRPALPGLALKEEPPRLPQQVNAWMRRFFPGAQVRVNLLREANATILQMGTQGDVHRPQNVGFGLTHVLPILVACLGAREGDLLLIENPESHLHPAGQSMMGRFLARAAAAGAQVILETHSDHVLNGVRLAIKEDALSPTEQVVIHFFVPRGDERRAQVTSPLIDSQGNLDHWPEGFFDQFDKDNSSLIGW